MEAFVKIRENYNREMRFSFRGNCVYILVDFDQELFEPNVEKTNFDFDQVKFMFDLFYMNRVIVEELRLNDRIWLR